MTWRSILARAGCAGVQLPGNYKVIIEAMDRLSGKHAECWHATATIARMAQCCERTVRNCIAALKSLGLVEVYYDYSKTTRRRIRLLWKHASNFFGFMVANVEPELPANVAAQIAIPPDPPIEEPEGNTYESGGECAPAPPDAPAAPPAEADATPPPPEIVPAPEKEGPTPIRATPEQIEEVVAKAKEVLPAQPRGWVLALARRWSLSWVRAALGRAAELVAEGRTVKPGFVITVLNGFKDEGGPPAELVAPARTEEEADRIFMEALNRTSWT